MSLRKIAASAILTRPKGGGQRASFKMKKGQDASRLRGRKASWDCSRGASPTIRWPFGWRFSHATIWHRPGCIQPCARHLRVVFEHAQSTSCLAYVGLTSLGRDSCALGRNSSSTRLFTLSASFRCNLEAMDTDTSPSRARLLRSLQGSCTPGFQNMCPGHSTLASEKMAP